MQGEFALTILKPDLELDSKGEPHATHLPCVLLTMERGTETVPNAERIAVYDVLGMLQVRVGGNRPMFRMKGVAGFGEIPSSL